MNLTRRGLGLTGAAAAVLAAGKATPARAATPLAPPGYPAYLSEIPFGANSHYLQPWRNMMATRSLASFTTGFGIQNADSSAPQSLAMFAACGITGLRVGIPWGAFDYDNPGSLTSSVASTLVPYIAASNQAGMRCLVLLQAFDQAPCPYQTSYLQLAAPLGAADTMMTLSSVAGLVPGFSGVTAVVNGGVFNIDPSGLKMCAVFFTDLSGDTATLSKPLGFGLPAGTTLIVNTLRAKPFAEIGSADYEATMAGWLGYVDAVSVTMSTILGTTGRANLGFDLEIWNELTFGSGFLDINNYYAAPVAAVSNAEFPPVAVDLVARVASHAQGNPALYAGVRIADGFSSVNPTPASSTEPGRITALTKHFYPTVTSFPQSNFALETLDANGDPTSNVPSYTIYNHEVAASAVAVYGTARDASIETSIAGVPRGIAARVIDGAVAPVGVWMTETGTATSAVGVTDPAEIAYVQTKGFLRSMFFNIGIGVERVYAFQGVGDMRQFAMVDPSAPTTPTLPLASLKRALSFVKGGVVGDVAGPLHEYAFQVGIAYGDETTIFTGDGTAACPNFVQPSDIVILPIQVSPTRTAFAFYFTGTDMRQDMNEVWLVVALINYGTPNATIAAYDPVYDVALPCANAATQNDVTLIVVGGIRDYPCFVTLDTSS